MQYVDFFGHKVSKLIVGDNPFNGHTYIPEIFPKQEVLDYHTEDKILESMHRMEELGINTMLPLADPYIIRILQHYRANGGKMNFIFQLYAPMMLRTSMRQMQSVDAIGVYVPGSFTDVRWETGRNHETFELLSELREMGIPVGLGSHYPEIIARSEEENWDADFYLACMYNFRRNREGQESGFITGKPKDGIEYVPEDRAKALNILKDVKKPILAFKIFAGGQLLRNKNEEEKRAAIKGSFSEVFSALKPDDMAVMGIYQKHSDQLGENVGLYEEWCREQGK